MRWGPGNGPCCEGLQQRACKRRPEATFPAEGRACERWRADARRVVAAPARRTLFILDKAGLFGTQAGDVYQVRLHGRWKTRP